MGWSRVAGVAVLCALAVTAWPGVPLLLGSLVLGKAARETGLGGFFGEVALVPVLAITHGGQLTARPAQVRLGHLQDEPARHGRVERIAASGQHIEPGLRCQRVCTGDGVGAGLVACGGRCDGRRRRAAATAANRNAGSGAHGDLNAHTFKVGVNYSF